jgi:serine/threonine protein kinase
MNQVDSPSRLDSSSLRAQVDAIAHSWSVGHQRPDAQAALEAHPELAENAEAVVDLAFQEFFLRRSAGEQLDIESFCARFPQQRGRLRHTLEMHTQFRTFSSFFERLPDLPEAQPLVRALKLQYPGPGAQLGDLTLVRELGRGSFGRVFLATEASTGDRPVVVKLTVEGGEEARTLGRLAHPNIVPILSTRRDEASGLTVVCMPFLGSGTLEDALRHLYPEQAPTLPRRAAALLEAVRAAARPEDPPLHAAAVEPLFVEGSFVEGVLHLGLRLAETLVFLHARPFYHRDLKPSNVLLTPEGRPLLLDFNLSEDGCLPQAKGGGTVSYMAPEQINRFLALLRKEDPESLPPLDGRADLFSLGVILFQLLTGQHPFDPIPISEDWQEMGRQMLERQRMARLALHRLNPQVPRRIAQLIERCLACDPADRPRDAVEVAAGLKRFFRPLPRLRRWLGRHPRLRAALLSLVLLTAGGTAWAVATRPPAAVRWTQQGDAAFLAGDLYPARDAYKAATDLDPDNPSLWFRRGQLNLALRDPETALTHFARADQLRPGDGPTLACLAYCCTHLGNQREAVAFGERALQQGMRTAAVYNNLACAYMRCNQGEKALERVKEALQLTPNLSAAHHNRALIIFQFKIPSGTWPGQALEDIRIAIANRPPHQELYRDAASLTLQALSDPSKVPPAKLRKDVMIYLQKAIDHGLSFDTIKGQRLVKQHVRGKDYEALQARSARSVGIPSRENPLLVPPCPDLRGK